MLGGDEKLCKALIPQFPLGCRRITPAPGYLEALRTSNTEVITEGIAEIVPEGIRLESGEIIKLDAIICATGFDNSFTPRFPIVGRHGNVQDAFKNASDDHVLNTLLRNVGSAAPASAPRTHDGARSTCSQIIAASVFGQAGTMVTNISKA